MARMKNQFDFMAGIYLDGELIFNKYTLMVDFYSLTDNMQDHHVGQDRLAYFIYDVVQRSVFVHEDDTPTIKAFTKLGVPVLTVPGIGPFDPIVLGVLATKMNLILEDALEISDAELTSAVGGMVTHVWDSSDEDDEIFAVVNDEDNTKWWASSSPRFMSYAEGTDADEIEAIKPFVVTWKNVGLPWYDEIEEDDEDELPITKKGKGKIIKANFTGDKPKKSK